MDETLLLTLHDQLVEWNGQDVTPSVNALRALVWAVAMDEDAKKNLLELVAREEMEILGMNSDFEGREHNDEERFVAWGWEKQTDCDGGK